MDYSSVTTLGSINYFLLFVGSTSLRTAVHGMQSEDQGPDAPEDFVKDNGASYYIRNDNSKMLNSKAWNKVLQSTFCTMLSTLAHATLSFYFCTLYMDHILLG